MSELPRKALLSRIALAKPSLIRLVAPAGFGKTVLIRQVTRDAPTLLLDTPTVFNDAIAEEYLERWAASPPGTTMVIDHAERLGTSIDASRALARLLAERPDGTRLVYSSRQPSFFHERISGPHETLSLRAGDLRFDLGEIERVFEGCGLDRATLERVAETSSGWPVVVLFLRRLETEGQLERYLADPEGVGAAKDMALYLSHQILRDLPAAERGALVVTAALNDFHVEDDVRAELDAEHAEPFRGLQNRGLLASDRGRLTVPPAIRLVLREVDSEDRRASLQHIAAVLARKGNLPRAAELLLMANAEARSAETLAQALAQASPVETEPILKVAERLSWSYVCQHRAMWWHVIMRRFHGGLDGALSSTGRAVLTLQASSCEPPISNTLRVTSALLAIADGNLSHARRILVAARADAANDEPKLRSFIEVLLAYVFSTAGDRSTVDAQIERALSLFREAREAFAPPLFVIAVRLAIEERSLPAQWERLVELYEDVVTHFPPNSAARCAAALYVAGFSENLVEVTQFAVQELAFLKSHDTAAAATLAAIEGTDDSSNPASSRSPIALIVAATRLAQAGQSAEASALFDAADALLEGVDDPFPHSLLQRKRDWALGVRSDLEHARHVALDALPAAMPLVRVASGSLLAGQTEHMLADRTLSLLTYLGYRDAVVSREELGENLWGNLPYRSQLNALKSCVYRSRSIVGEDRIVSIRDGYQLRGLRFDIFEAEKFFERNPELVALESLDEAVAAAKVLSSGLAPELTRLDCFEQLLARIELKAEVSWQVIGDAAIPRGDHVTLHRCVDWLRQLDPASDIAFSLLIRWHLSREERALAIDLFRKYRALLSKEERGEPREDIVRLVSNL